MQQYRCLQVADHTLDVSRVRVVLVAINGALTAFQSDATSVQVKIEVQHNIWSSEGDPLGKKRTTSGSRVFLARTAKVASVPHAHGSGNLVRARRTTLARQMPHQQSSVPMGHAQALAQFAQRAQAAHLSSAAGCR